MQRKIVRKIIMPKIFEYFGFIFFFYSNEHEPIHVHVTHGGCQSVFELIMLDGELVDIRLREKVGEEPLSAKDQKTAEAFIRKYYPNIISNAGNLMVDLLFSDQTSRRVDIGDFIRRHPHPQYNKYLDPRKFNHFVLENGNIVWGKNWDLMFPIEQLHSGALA